MLWISRYVIGGLETVQPILDEQAFLVTNFLSFITKEKSYKLVIMYFSFHFPSLGWFNK